MRDKQALTEREFLTVDVMSAASGFLLTEEGIGAVYNVLNFATGESVFTHQIPRIGKEFCAALCSGRPDIEEAIQYIRANTTRDTFKDVAAEIEKRFGVSMTVRRMTEDEHERVDPLSELAEKVHPSCIIAINASGHSGER